MVGRPVRCTRGQMEGRMDGRTDEPMDGRAVGWSVGRMDSRSDGWEETAKWCLRYSANSVNGLSSTQTLVCLRADVRTSIDRDWLAQRWFEV